MNNMLLAFIFGPIEVVVPVFLTILGIVGVFSFCFDYGKERRKRYFGKWYGCIS